MSEAERESYERESAAAPEGITRRQAVALAVIRKATRGDASAVKFLCEAAGEEEKPTAAKAQPYTLELVVRDANED